MPLATPACNVESMYPHFLLKRGEGGGGRGGVRELPGICQKDSTVLIEGIITLTSLIVVHDCRKRPGSLPPHTLAS